MIPLLHPAQLRAQRLWLAGFVCYWLVFLHIGWFSHGGWGTDLPMNLLAWCVMAGLGGMYWGLSRRCVQWGGKTSLLLVSGALLMSLPLLWSPSRAMLDNALPRIAGIWAGLAFWLTLRQCHFSPRQQQLLLTCLALAGLVEACIVLLELSGHVSGLPRIWQMMLEKYGRGGVGVFQQVNVTASFLAMSLGATLLLLGLKTATLPSCRLESIRAGVLMITTVLLSVALTMIYSRTGWLGGGMVTLGVYALFACRRYRKAGHRRIRLWLLPLLGVVIGLFLMKLSVLQALAVHEGSNHQRLLTLHQTLRYALQHPLTGYGAGTYEGAYQAWLAALPGGNPGGEMMAHPHNELLYQFAEGGVVALAGALLWCLLYLRCWRRVKTPAQAGTLMAMLPLLAHTQLEYPLYYSVPHWLALLLLLRLSEDEEVTRVSVHPGRPGKGYLFRAGMVLLMLYGVTVSWQAFRAGQVLDLFENTELKNPEAIAGLQVPWILRQRHEQDLTQLRLIRFQSVPDWLSLRAYTEENAVWLSVHAWPELYRNQIAVLRYLHEDEQAKDWQERARRTLPWEFREGPSASEPR